MAKTERVRDRLTAAPSEAYLREKQEEGWRPVAMEWERPSDPQREEDGRVKEEVPYGLEVSSDRRYLVENPAEVAAMTLMLERIVDDEPLSAVAEELTRRGHLRRNGRPWTQVSLFNLLPRLVEVAPRIYASEDWSSKVRHLRKVYG